MPARPSLPHGRPAVGVVGATEQHPGSTTAPPPEPGRPWTRRVSDFLDAAVEWAVAAFAAWTVLYHLGLLTGLPGTVAFGAWLLCAAALAAVRIRVRRPSPLVPAGARTGVAIAVAATFAVLSSVLVRPDLDDASYTVRSTWVAERGTLGTGDVIFSGGTWPALGEQRPYLPAIEALLGWSARTSGMAPGDVVYVLYVPLASFGAVWALWMLFRSWAARSPAAALAVAAVFLLWGGAEHASWGNLHLGRIWQGKVVFLAVVVPLLYAWAARYWDAETARGRASALALVALAGISSAGLTPAAVFVVPGILVAAAVPGLLRGRPARSLALLACGASYPLAAGLVVVWNRAGTTLSPGPPEDPWVKTLGTGPLWWVAVAAAAVALIALVPGGPRTSGAVGRVTAAAAVLMGLAITVPALYALAVQVMGTNAIAWRLVWVVPVPALVGLLACLPRRVPVLAAATPVAVVAALVVLGTPLWSQANGAELARPGAWKMSPDDVATARWIVGSGATGTYLAPVGVVAAVGTMSADLRPVSSRGDYLVQYDALPEARTAERLLLQRWIDGTPPAADAAAVAAALDLFDVEVVCAAHESPAEPAGGWTQAHRTDRHVCWRR